jgi:large subunit ribosomal protein L9
MAAMEVILTEDVAKLGHAGELVKVKPGFARNYLLPRGMALLATAGRIADIEHKKRVIDEAQRRLVGSLEAVAKRLGAVELEFQMQAGEEGKLFGSVTAADIHRQLVDRGFDVERRKIDLDSPVKQVGEYQVPIRLHRQVVTEIKIRVVSIGGPPPAEAEAEAAGEEAEIETEE